jgi:hypothetical protein
MNCCKYIMIIGAVLMGMATSCKKSNYLTDGGVHDPKTPLSNYDYLAQHPWKSFDTLLTIIDHYGLKNEVNSAATFFAPTNYSITAYMKIKLANARLIDENATYTFDSLYSDITIDSVKQYLFSQRITLNEAKNEAQVYTSLGNTPCAVVKQLQTDYQYVERSSAATYLLYFIKVRGALDMPGTPPPANETDVQVVCQTTGIQTSNGATLLHVLSNRHIFSSF